MESYNGLAQIYDNTIDMDYEKWTKFVFEYFKNKGIELKGKKLLELACGTGNMTLRLKSQGIDITAIDLSDEMLYAAQQKALKKRCKILFVNQNIIDFNINKKFDLVFSFCDGYNYITEETDLAKSFGRVYSHLNNGGYFLFDISTPFKLKNNIGNNTFTCNEGEMYYIWDNYIDDDILEMYITFFVKEGSLYRRFKEHHVQRAWEYDYLKESLNRAGFKDIDTFDDYTFNKAQDNSIRATFICKKEK